jgi:hypothetical protein
MKIEVPTADDLHRMFALNGVPPSDYASWYEGVRAGIVYANEQLALADQPVEAWRPTRGMKVVGWGHNYDKDEHHRTTMGYYMHLAEGGYHEFSDVNDGTVYTRLYVAQLDTLDEIGKPPSYFIERDNRHT